MQLFPVYPCSDKTPFDILHTMFANEQSCAQRTLTSGVSVYPYVETLYDIAGIRYSTVEDPCCSPLRMAVEPHRWNRVRKSYHKGRSFSSSVEW